MLTGFLEACVPNAVATLVVDYVVKPIVRQFRYLCCFHTIEEELQKKQQNLTDKQEVVNAQRNEAKLNIETLVPLKSVTKWSEDAKSAQKDVESLKHRIDEKKKCFCNWGGPNWYWRYRLGRDMQNKADDLHKLVEESDHFKLFGLRAEFRGIPFMPSENVMTFKSSAAAFNQITENLMDEQVKIIGVWGIGGVGKTTLVTQVGTQVLKSHLFDKVIYVEVTETPSIELIQNTIADNIYLTFKSKEQKGKAEELLLRLEDENKFLIILDNMWKKLGLKEIGIPLEKNGKGCKIILATRRGTVCKDMGCQDKAIVSMDLLEDDEAWELFKVNAELVETALPDNIKEEAKKIVAECNRLPVAIVTVAKALRGAKTLDDWKDAHEQLEESRLPEIGNIEEEEEEEEEGREGERNAYRCIEMSYKYLKTETYRKCFLLCALYPEGHSIDVEDLVQYAWGLEFYNKSSSIKHVRTKVLQAIDFLKDSSLVLEAGNVGRNVKLHGIVRDAALWISSKEETRFTIKSSSESLNEPSIAISLFESEGKVKSFPMRLPCPKLEILLLKNYDVRGVCFQGMQELKVLSLMIRRSSISFYPYPCLGKLRVLHLQGYGDLSFLGNLWSLEILRLRNSRLSGLEELGNLENLKILDMARCVCFSPFPPNMIRYLSKLEELFLRDIYIEAESDDILEEINSLPCLRELSLAVQCSDFPQDFVFRKDLERFEIRINRRGAGPLGTERWLDVEKSLTIGGVIDLNPISELLKNIESLEVQHLGKAEYVECLSDKTQNKVSVSAILQSLKQVKIKNCKYLKSVFQLGDVRAGESFQPLLLLNVKYLYLQLLENLRQIWDLPIKHVRLEGLVDLRIRGCNSLESVFSVSLAQSLAVLENLQITYCDALKQIVTEEEEEEDDDEGEIMSSTINSLCFPKLTTLEIKHCKGLEYIFPTSMTPQGLQQLEKLVLEHCGELKHVVRPRIEGRVEVLQQLQFSNPWMQFSVKVCPLLKYPFQVDKSVVEGVGSSTFNESSVSSKHLDLSAIEYHNLVPEAKKDGLNGINSLVLSSCENLECLVDTTTGNGPASSAFSDLEILSIEDMGVLEGVCKGEPPQGFLNNLKQLHVRRCKNLRWILRGSVHSFSLRSLKVVEINSCSEMESLFSASLIQSLEMLEELSVSHCDRLRSLFTQPENDVEGESKTCLPQLKTLTIEGCPQLEHVLPVTLAKDLPSLESISVTACDGLTQVFGMGKEQSGVKQDGILRLGGLKDVRLDRLNDLTSFVPENYVVKAPALESLKVDYCSQLMINFSFEQVNTRMSLKRGVFSPFSERPDSLEGLPIDEWEVLECLVDAAKVIDQAPDLIKNLDVTRFVRLQKVFQDKETQAPSLLSNLEYLKLEFLPELRWIVEKPTHCSKLQCLKVLEIETCDNLEYLFKLSVVQTLGSLEELKIGDCNKLKRVFVELESDDGNGTKSSTRCCFPNLKTVEIKHCQSLEYVFWPLALSPRLPRLQTIRLDGLEKLSGFVAKNQSVDAPAMKILLVSGCPRFTNFIIQKVANNKSLSLKELAFSFPEVSYDNHPESYNMLSVQPSPSFEYACMGNFEQLFQLQGGYLISYVKNLRFSNMIWLQHIWKGVIQVATNLRSLTIHSCPRLTYIFPITLVPHLPQLNYLEIENCDKLERIIIANYDILQSVTSSSQGRRYSQIGFRQLETMKLKGLPSLVSFLPVGYHLVFRNLESLEVENCFMMIPNFMVDYSALVVHAKTSHGPSLNNNSINWDWHRPYELPEYVEEAEQISAWN